MAPAISGEDRLGHDGIVDTRTSGHTADVLGGRLARSRPVAGTAEGSEFVQSTAITLGCAPNRVTGSTRSTVPASSSGAAGRARWAGKAGNVKMSAQLFDFLHAGVSRWRTQANRVFRRGGANGETNRYLRCPSMPSRWQRSWTNDILTVKSSTVWKENP